jgi:hypothetical protein
MTKMTTSKKHSLISRALCAVLPRVIIKLQMHGCMAETPVFEYIGVATPRDPVSRYFITVRVLSWWRGKEGSDMMRTEHKNSLRHAWGPFWYLED